MADRFLAVQYFDGKFVPFDPFDDLNDEFDDELYYADMHEKEQAGLEDTIDQIFGNSDDEDFYGF